MICPGTGPLAWTEARIPVEVGIFEVVVWQEGAADVPVYGKFGFASIEGMVMMMVIVIAMMMIRAGHLGCLALEADVLARCTFVAMHGDRMRACVRASMSRECMAGGRAAEGGTACTGSGAAAAHSAAAEMASAPAARAMTATGVTATATGVTATAAGVTATAAA